MITYLEAICAAQAKALNEDHRVFIYGQDVGNFGGAFKATKGLAAQFPGRVVDSPISEDAQMGLAVGAAIEGARPIIEMQFADFSSVAFGQIVNHAATLYWRTQTACPLVVRLPSGGNAGSGPFHSQCMEAIYAHYPGLVVMTPATVEDAYTMLLQAIAIDDPVIFCEHKLLYYHLKAERLPSIHRVAGAPADANTGFSWLSLDDPILPTRARIARPGTDLTIVAYSAMVHEALTAAQVLKDELQADVEVVDLRTVKPLDLETILESVSRTGRLLAVGEAGPWGGVTAEVVARVSAEGFRYLDAPPRRINAKPTPVPYHPNLWKSHRPSSDLIVQTSRELLRF